MPEILKFIPLDAPSAFAKLGEASKLEASRLEASKLDEASKLGEASRWSGRHALS